MQHNSSRTSRYLSPHTLTAVFLLLSAAISIAILSQRNLYDDEILSLPHILAPVRDILRFAALHDVHPPGMYLLAHLAYMVLPSYRWLNLIPGLITYAGLAIFLFQVTPLFTRTRAQVCLLVLATLHPQLLMWGATFRWYGWWTGLALIALTIALQPLAIVPRFGVARSITLGLLLAGLFYLNYITLLFAVALAAAMLLRYRDQLRRLLLPSLIAAAILAALIAPQIRTMIVVHLPNGRVQRYGILDSLLRLTESIVVSEAYLPWHPLAILAGLLFIAICIIGARAFLKRPPEPSTYTALASINLFALTFFLLVAVSGLGGKPRNGLLLIPVLAPIAAWIVSTLRPRAQNAVLLFFALWSSVGVAHMVRRYGLTKAFMTARPEQVVAFVQQTSGPACSVVVTYDAPLAFALNQSNLQRLVILTPFSEPTFGSQRMLPAGDCAHTTLYAVHSYTGEDIDWANTLDSELDLATRTITGPTSTHAFSFDPESSRKRSLARIAHLGDLASATRLPDYRFTVTSGPIDRTRIDAMHHRMPDFINVPIPANP